MGDIKGTVSKAEIKPETPKNDEDDIQDTNITVKSLRSMASHMQKKSAADMSGHSSCTMSICNKNLLTVCKPMSVKLIRLPDVVINKFKQAADERAKRRKKCMWKVGICYKDKSRQLKRQKRLHQEKSMLLKWLQSGSNEKSENGVEKPKLEEIEVGEISKISESELAEESPSEKFELPTQLVGAEENDINKNAECTENTETATEASTRLELTESESLVTAKTSEISPHKTDQTSYPEISDIIEIHLATKIPQVLSNAAVDTTDILSQSSPVVPSETINNQNRKISLKRLFEQDNSITTQFIKLRRRTLQYNDQTDATQNHLSKKYESASGSDLPEEMDTIPEKSNSKLMKSSVPVTEAFAVNKPSRTNPKSVRRRSIHTEKIPLREIKVVLCRLENSRDPLVLEWARTNYWTHSNDIISSEGRSPTKNRAVEEYSKIGTVVAGVPITSLEDLSGTLDISKSLNGTEKSCTDELSNEDTSPILEDVNVEPITSEETSKSQDSSEDDDEIVQFLRRRRKVRPSIDSSSSTSSSSLQTFVSTRVLRSKTPTVNGLLEKIAESSGPRKTPRLRIRENSTSTDSSSEQEIPEPNCQEPANTLLLRKRETRGSTNSTSESSEASQEPPRTPSSRRKSIQVAKDDKSVDKAEDSNVFVSEEKAIVSAPFNDSADQKNSLIVEENEVEIAKETKNSSVATTSNFVPCGENQEDEVTLDSLTEVNRHFTEIGDANSDSCNEVLIARRQLTAVKNAMVVLTRLEDLDGNEIDLNNAEDFGISRSSTPDPLAINKNDDLHSLPETENSIVPFNGAVRISPRKTLRSDVAAITDIQSSQESQESDVDMHLSLEDANSQETIESDVEMTLIFEENSSQEAEDSYAEFATSKGVNRTKLASRDTGESPDLVVLDTEKAAESHDVEATNSIQSSSANSVQNLPDGILTDARSNGGDSRKIPENYEGLDEHCKYCACEEHKSDNRRLKCQNIPGLYKCVKCKIIFKDVASLEAHKNTDTACSSAFLCNICETGFLTNNELIIHRRSCVNKVLQKQSSVDASTNVEVTSEAGNPPVTNSEKSSTKANQKSEKNWKVSSRRMRAKNRGTIDNLKCGVCSITFRTTQALSEHIFKHNTEELQQAYKNAKAKVVEDGKPSKAAAAKQKGSPSPEQEAPHCVSIEAPKDNSLPQQSSAEIATPITATVANSDTNAKSVTVCLCHRDKHPACPDKADLQIEMVLLCQYCMVIFRRRECFEIHYRTSPQCADRTRGRSPKLYCANCQATLNSWAGMRRHLEVHASLNVEGTVRFVCNICRVIFVGFGALFYNHWSSHLKDTMFVASRYSFPKNSVQPIDGIPRLPLGATSDESYILVAEHVCTKCKKPFSTRRDLEMHEKSKICDEGDKAIAPEKQWHCDVCNLSFTSRRDFNMHSQAQHAHRFLCVATSPLTPAYMCTRCFAMRKLVADIEDHWRTASQHNTPLGLVEPETLTEKTPETGQACDNGNGSTEVNEIAKKSALHTSADETGVNNSGEKSVDKNVESLVDISESVEPEITCIFQSPPKTTRNQAARVNNEESQLALINSSESSSKPANDSAMLRNLLRPSPTPDNKERPKAKALEDSCVDIVLSNVSETNVSAKLVINESRTNSLNDSNAETNIDTYKIVMTPKASSGNLQVEKNATKTTESSKETNNEDSTVNTSDATIVAACKPKLTDNKDSPRKSPLNPDLPAKTPDTADGKGNKKSLESPAIKKPDSLVSIYLKQKLAEIRLTKSKTRFPASGSTVPEIIDLSDEKEEAETSSAAAKEKSSKPTSVITKNNAKTVAGNKCGSGKSKRAASRSKPPAKTKSVNESGASKPEAYPFVLDTAEKSFEEVRFADYTRSKELAAKDAAASKKPGFLRVKNLSELQAIKIHNCLNCNTVFETHNDLEEHYRSRMCASLEKQPDYPKGMTGALILPDNSNATTTQTLPTVYTAGNVVTQQLIGLDPGLGVISGVPVSSVIVNNEPPGSWITVGGQPDSISSVALVNTTHSLSGGTLLMNLAGQQSANDNPNTLMATSIATSTATIAQTQEILAVQQQQQQQYQQLRQQPQYHQQQQQYQQPQYQQQQQRYQQQPILGMNQQLGDNCNRQLGFHVMPAMVLPQTTQINKQQCTDGALRNTSIANLPINGHINGVPYTYHSNKPNRYICSICSSYSCNSIGTMNVHVMKHYTGFNNPTSQNTSQTAAGGLPNIGFQGAKDKNTQNVALSAKTHEANVIGDRMKDNVFLKNTPQGLVWVTSVATQMTNQQPGSSAGPENSLISGGKSSIRGGQVVYRCLICKCAMYKTYPPLRNHVVLVHGISDLISAGLDNIVQKIYLCTHCPHGAAMYDSEESHRQHVDSCHSIACLNCGRAFATHNSLKMHMTGCSGANRDTNNASDKNC